MFPVGNATGQEASHEWHVVARLRINGAAPPVPLFLSTVRTVTKWPLICFITETRTVWRSSCLQGKGNTAKYLPAQRRFNALKPSGHYTYRTVVTICTVQWSLYAPHIGHYMYRPVVTICTAHWSLYVPHSGHYTCRTVVTICTEQWSLYLPSSGHYMYRTVVTICTAQWSLYVPPV